MFHQIFLSLQVKLCTIITYKRGKSAQNSLLGAAVTWNQSEIYLTCCLL